MTDSFDVSVVTPTYNRKESLRRVLAALDRQSAPPETFEVVVVDDGSTDGTSETFRDGDYRFSLRMFRQQNAGPARARNRGVEEARGKRILFLDDDVEPHRDLVREHQHSHGAEPRELVVIGPLSSLPHYPEPWVAWEQAKIEAQYDAMVRGILVPTFRQFWTGNASVGREHLVAVGGFDPTYLRGEDVELGGRLHERGLEFRFNPRAIGIHHASRSLDSWCRAHEHYGRVEVQIFGKLGENELIEVLAGNFSRLHVGTRAVLRAALARPEVHAASVAALKALLLSRAAALSPKVTSKACSVLANLLYFGESAEALGPARKARLLRRADELVRTGVEEFGSIPKGV